MAPPENSIDRYTPSGEVGLMFYQHQRKSAINSISDLLPALKGGASRA